MNSWIEDFTTRNRNQEPEHRNQGPQHSAEEIQVAAKMLLEMLTLDSQKKMLSVGFYILICGTITQTWDRGWRTAIHHWQRGSWATEWAQHPLTEGKIDQFGLSKRRFTADSASCCACRYLLLYYTCGSRSIIIDARYELFSNGCSVPVDSPTLIFGWFVWTRIDAL